MYSEHYGLNGRPFQLTPDPRFWFESATHRKAMAYLGYGLAQAEGFIVVTGEIGAGKTTLVGHLMASVDPARVHAVRIASTQVDGDDLLRLVAQAMGIATDGAEKAQLLGRIEALLGDRARAGQKSLLIVDEAQSLPVELLEELRMLSNFQGSGQALLQILLLGQPEFRDKLNSLDLEQLRQRVIATHHLTAMQRDEVGPYVQHRLKLVGWGGNPQFTEDAFAALHTASGGIPRKLNMIVTRALLLGAIEKAGIIDRRIVNSVMADMGNDVPDEAEVAAETLTPKAKVSAVAEPRVEAPVAEPKLEAVRSSPAPVAVPTLADSAALDAVARITMLEAQVAEQDAALRRVLTLMVDWVESENAARLQVGLSRVPA